MLKFLIDRCLGVDLEHQNKDKLLKGTISLITCLMESFKSIRLKFNFQSVKRNISMLDEEFHVTSFMLQTEYKEQKIMPLNDTRANQQPDDSNYFNSIAELLNKLIRSGKKLPALLGTKDINEISLYFMMLIELNRLCIENSSIKLEFSSDIDTVIQLRKNNRFSLALTLTH